MQEQPQFKSGVWEVELNVRDFVSQNVTPYDGDSSFLSGPTEKTKRVWEHCLQALKEERENPHRPGTRERERRRGRGPLVAVCMSLGRAR